MTDTTTWTPEARKIREAERAGARKALLNLPPAVAEAQVDALFPPPPPKYAYGREILGVSGNCSTYLHRRRSDGTWEYKGVRDWTQSSNYTDVYVRTLAAEVPFTDLECKYLLSVCLANRHASISTQSEAVRFALVRVLRGEVK